MVLTAPFEPFELRLRDEKLFVYRNDVGGNDPVAELVFELQPEKGDPEPFVASRLDLAEGGFELNGHLWDLITLDVLIRDDPALNGVSMRVRVVNTSDPVRCRLGVRLRNIAGQDPRWMIPGIFYNHNRPKNCVRVFPSFALETKRPERMISNAWSFRSDRAATPVVFLWNTDVGAFMMTEERVGVNDDNRMGIGMTGLSFRSDGKRSEIGVHLPYAETPVKYSYCHADRTAPEIQYLDLRSNEELDWEVWFGIGGCHVHSYDSVLREISKRNAPAHPIRPWVKAEEAEVLAASAMLTWHANPQEGLLYETAAFNKYFGKMGGYVDRPEMYTGWQGGASAAFSLLLYGYDRDDTVATETARAVLDRIANGLTPLGTFWPQWNDEIGWTTGVNPDEKWIQSRTIADAALYMVRALRLEAEKGISHPKWLQAIQSNLDFAVKTQRGDGNFGTCYNVETGEVTEWDGCAGMAWISALAAGCALLNERRYRDAAIWAGNYYEGFLGNEFLYGSAEDLFMTPGVEDGYCALTAYLLLYELDRSRRWLNLAKHAAEWALTFRYTYNVVYPRNSILERYGFRTRGADIYSPAQQVIRGFGLSSYPEMVKLSKLTGDPYYANRAEEQRICHLQMIAREDAEFGARKGMAPDQIFHTDWWQPKGTLQTLSRAGFLGRILYANLNSRLSSVGGAIATETKTQAPVAAREEVREKEPEPSPSPRFDRPWASTDPRETQEIQIKWKIF